MNKRNGWGRCGCRARQAVLAFRSRRGYRLGLAFWSRRGYRLRLCGLAAVLLAVCGLTGCSGHIFHRGMGGQDTEISDREADGTDRQGMTAGQERGQADESAGMNRQETAERSDSQADGREAEERPDSEADGRETEEQPGSEADGRETARFDVMEGAAETLPRRYDGREQGRTSTVKDQGELGTCWAFASMLSLENALLPQEVWDFSEDHMSHDPSFHLGQENGGEYTMAMAYLLSWQGPVTEEQDPYGDGVSPENLKAVKHVQQVQVLPERDLERIKRAVMRSGGVQSSMYTTIKSASDQSQFYNRKTAAYCYPEETAPNHDVVIVGWDDDFPREAFSVEVPDDGAFICENSWGTRFGEDGFFYVSYYDGNLGTHNVVYTGIEAPDNYDRIYQSDLCGWTGQLGYGEETAWGANVYVAETREQLKAVGFYAVDQMTEYEVYVMIGVPEQPQEGGFDIGKAAVKGTLAYSGFYTVPLENGIDLKPGERFAVIVRLTTPGVIHPIAVEYDTGDGKCKIDLADGEGYISLDGLRWEHVEESQSCNICLKAYTQER